MKKSYLVCTYGCDGGDKYEDREEAFKALRALVDEELARAKRKSETATKHKISDKNYHVTLGREQHSALWSAHYLEEY